jgi:sugar/nucleoside kinase (ribokinase family)
MSNEIIRIEGSEILPKQVRTYVRDAVSENTRRAYRADLDHFTAWGGSVPASPEIIARHLSDHAEVLSMATLKRRLAALSVAHEARSLTSPTSTKLVHATLRGIQRIHGTMVSYDLNYRPSLWQGFGGLEKCREINREIAQYVDVMIGNEEDFTACLGFEVEGADENLTDLEVGAFQKMIEQAVAEFSNFKATATTMRGVKSASVNDWGAMCWMDGKFYTSTQRPNMEIMDRVGGGDSFASGFIYGLMTFGDAQTAVEYGAAHGALAMTTPGDTTMASLKEVEKLVGGGGARVDR